MDSHQFKNIDVKTEEGFGDEWARFDQTGMSDEDAKRFLVVIFRFPLG